MLVGREDMIVLLRLQGQCVCVIPNREMPRQLLRWFHHELAAMGIHGPNGDQSSCPYPRLIRKGVGRDP